MAKLKSGAITIDPVAGSPAETWHERPVGSVKDAKASPDTDGVLGHYRESELVGAEKQRARQLKMALSTPSLRKAGTDCLPKR